MSYWVDHPEIGPRIKDVAILIVAGDLERQYRGRPMSPRDQCILTASVFRRLEDLRRHNEVFAQLPSLRVDWNGFGQIVLTWEMA